MWALCKPGVPPHTQAPSIHFSFIANKLPRRDTSMFTTGAMGQHVQCLCRHHLQLGPLRYLIPFAPLASPSLSVSVGPTKCFCRSSSIFHDEWFFFFLFYWYKFDKEVTENSRKLLFVTW